VIHYAKVKCNQDIAGPKHLEKFHDLQLIPLIRFFSLDWTNGPGGKAKIWSKFGKKAIISAPNCSIGLNFGV